MRRSSTLALVVAVGLAACSGNRTDTSTMPVGFMGPVWNGNLSATSALPSSRISGDALMIGNSSHTQTRIQLDVRHAQPGSELPWHLHRGTCGNDQGIVGDPAKYQALKVGADGIVSGVAIVDVPLPDAGQYMVNVHASPAEMKTVIACGELVGPA